MNYTAMKPFGCQLIHIYKDDNDVSICCRTRPIGETEFNPKVIVNMDDVTIANTNFDEFCKACLGEYAKETEEI